MKPLGEVFNIETYYRTGGASAKSETTLWMWAACVNQLYPRT